MHVYPWYESVVGEQLEQGDVLRGCPLFVIRPGAADDPAGHPVIVQRRTVVVMTQSCDLVDRPGRGPAASDVILCPVYSRPELSADPVFGKASAWEEARKGRIPSAHVLNGSDLPGLEVDRMLVDFRRAYSLGFDLLRSVARAAGPRLRLLPPYREHLSQGFARLFMRVGLPVDVPPFK